MAAKTGVSGIDHDSWQATILPLPKGYSRGSIYGFCNGHAVGHAEKARSGSFGCWWPDRKPELLTIEGRKYVSCAGANGSVIPGMWREESSELRAAAWAHRDGKLRSRVLHTNSFDQTWSTASFEEWVVGMGRRPAEPGQRSRTIGLVWRDAAEPVAISAERDVALYATDGTRLAGSIHGSATLWPAFESAPIDLNPPKMQMSEIRALDGALQVGTAFRKFRARAGVWSGSRESFVDLTPSGFEVSGASGAMGGYQAGSIRKKENTRNGTPGSDNRAVIWQGAADRWFDLQALLPPNYNASRSIAIHIAGDVLQVGGEANQYEVTREDSPYEGHVVPVAQPVIWTARLR